MSRFKYSVGPWNVHNGADSYVPATRDEISFEEKVKNFAEMGFSAIQFHDDDAVPNMNDLTEEGIKAEKFDYEFQRLCVQSRDFEALEMYVMELLMTG